MVQVNNNKYSVEAELSDYQILVGNLLEKEDARGYLLYNKITDVFETETTLLPSAYEYLEQLQAGLDAKRDMMATDAEVVDVDEEVVIYEH